MEYTLWFNCPCISRRILNTIRNFLCTGLVYFIKLQSHCSAHEFADIALAIAYTKCKAMVSLLVSCQHFRLFIVILASNQMFSPFISLAFHWLTKSAISELSSSQLTTRTPSITKDINLKNRLPFNDYMQWFCLSKNTYYSMTTCSTLI